MKKYFYWSENKGLSYKKVELKTRQEQLHLISKHNNLGHRWFIKQGKEVIVKCEFLELLESFAKRIKK